MVYDFGLRLKELRIAKGLSQTQAAKLIGISKTSISNYENNFTLPNIDMLKSFATFYRVSADYLLGLEQDKVFAFDLKCPEDEMIVRQVLEVLQNALNKSRS